MRALCAAFVFLLTNLVYANEMKSADQIVHITAKDGELFSWVHHGALFFRSHGRMKAGEYLYRGNNGHLAVVSGNLEEISELIREEFENVQQLDLFLLSKFSDVIVSFMGSPHMYRISKEYIKSRESLPLYAWEGHKPTEIQKSLDVLKNYESVGKPIIENEKWRLEFYVTMQDGSIEKWYLEGNMHPFSIGHLNKAVIEKKGSVIPMPEVGG